MNLVHPDFSPRIFSTSYYRLQGFINIPLTPIPTAIVYIEGDGAAWVDRYTPALNPTPINPVALRLALKSKDSMPVIYLARPCQYVQDLSLCSSDVWTCHRFHPMVLETYHEVLTKLKKEFKMEKFIIVGYSGGATIALLLAATRSDIKKIITIAGLLDPDAWAQFHELSPLTNSLNPLTFKKELYTVPQIHYAGEKDTVIPPILTFKYQEQMNSPFIKVVVVSDMEHDSEWHTFWNPITLN